MPSLETESMAIYVSSLTKSFGKVHSAAVPSILDCILTSTGLSTCMLFDSLLDELSNFIKVILTPKRGRLDSAQSSYIASFISALCYLLKISGTNPSDLKSFIWRGFLPTINIVSGTDQELLNQIAEQMCDVVIESNTWEVIKVTLVPFCLRSVEGLVFSDPAIGLNADEDSISLLSVSLPLAISCYLLTFLLEVSIARSQTTQSTLEPVLVNAHSENFARDLLWYLCDATVRMLTQCQEDRSCAIRLLSFIFKAFVSYSSVQISLGGKSNVLSREDFCGKIWKCCRTLFSFGPLERKDAYNVLSLYLYFFFNREGTADASLLNGIEQFDIRDKQEFWKEMKRGLVDKESLIRKQSLHILKMSLQRSDESRCHFGVAETTSLEKISTPCVMTKRERWAEKEAKSLGVGQLCKAAKSCLNGHQRWEAFLLLYEMLEEYGTHLVEAAWNHQISLLLNFSQVSSLDTCNGGPYRIQMETLEGIFCWLAVLWQRGLCHENPQVRCLIMQSFLGIDWENQGNCSKLVPESFILGPFLQGLNDHVQHKEFGIKGVYSSQTIEDAANFLFHFSGHLCMRERVAFLCRLASVAKEESFGRSGLMALSVCIASSAGGRSQMCKVALDDMVQMGSTGKSFHPNSKSDLLDILRLLIESSKQHFNQNYRLRVCEKVVEAAASVMCASDVPLETLMHFFATMPREFTDYRGYLRGKVQEWLSELNKKHYYSDSPTTEMLILRSLCDFPKRFTEEHLSSDVNFSYNDEDLDAWGFEAQRWARVLFLVITEEHHFEQILQFFQNHGANICKQINHLGWNPAKFLILGLSLVQELQITYGKFNDCGSKSRNDEEVGMPDMSDCSNAAMFCRVFEKFTDTFFFILEELVSFTKSACSIFWSSPATVEALLPCSVTGKLGGPSQRRLASSTTSAVLQAIISLKTISSVSSWCAHFKNADLPDSTFTYLWRFSQKVILSPTYESETGAEIRLAAYEALVPVLKALTSATCPIGFELMMADDKSLFPGGKDKPLLDSFVLSFLQNINELLEVGVLARSRRAVLMNWKWLCLDSLLSIPSRVAQNGVHLGGTTVFFSTAAVKYIFSDLVESLENAGESSVLPILRSVRLVLELLASGELGSVLSSSNGVDTKMMQYLVHSSWILHVSCNKRRVAPIAALLSSLLHSSVFGEARMHETVDDTQGPLKWFVGKILDEGMRSPRTIRLASLHLTGSWLLYPKIIKYYIKELKLLSLYGSVAFDEDFEAELTESRDARIEVSLLAESPNPEFTEAFINTELYARVSVAVLFYNLAHLADKSGSKNENEDCRDALHSGKLFLIELLDSVLNDTDLAKELYKKYSAIHRRKVRAWQMICILSKFVDEDIVQQVTSSLHTCLYRNNLPAVRQYLETFAIQIYLRFPSLVKEQLIPILRDYNMRPQALSSYVFIAANIILHATEKIHQLRHLDELLPPIVPLLTSHHHSLRGFTQLLVYRILCEVVPAIDSNGSEHGSLEKRCFEDLKLYLEKNTDCTRLRASMEGILNSFVPNTCATPAGIFATQDEDLGFECVPIALMEKVVTFLNYVRDDLRCSMAKDVVTIKNESLTSGEMCNGLMEVPVMANQEKLPSQSSMDFQKKISLSKHEMQEKNAISFLSFLDLYKPLLEMEKEDQLLNQVLQSRNMAIQNIRASRQHIIVVASLLDRIPNLAGLARTCEVFKAAGLAIADASVVHDKQFQLISVTAEKWVPILEVPVNSMKVFLEKKKREGFSILGLEQTANSVPLNQFAFPKKTVLVLGREKEGIPVDIIHVLDACVEIPQFGVVRSLNVHVSGAIAIWEYTRQQQSVQS